MGWSGYGLYDGDGTQSHHIGFIQAAIPDLDKDEIFNMMGIKKTSIPNKYIKQFKDGIPKIIDNIKFPSSIFKLDEDTALEWQMLLVLFIDNNIKVPHKVLVNGIISSNYLLGEHCDGFDEPSKRRSVIKRFIKKADAYCSVKARSEISKKLDALK